MSPKTTTITIAFGLALACLGGCETEKAYAACQLDKEVTSKNICSGGKGASTDNSTSCVVRTHPHCADHICLSYFSRQAVCTHACVTDGDCNDDGIVGTCWEFAGPVDGKAAERYCVPPDDFYENLVVE
jgi:hypothetical protein